MEIEIRYTDKINEEISYELGKLSSLIGNDCDVNVKNIQQPIQQGQKDVLIIGLAIATFALSAIDTLINILNYWESQQTEYSVSFSIDGKTYSLKSNSLKTLKDALSELEQNSKPKAEILIAKK